MKKIVIIYGLISGVIISAYMLVTMEIFKDREDHIESGMLIGYTGMVIALSLIFFGVKSLRDNQFSGVITFWKATQAGLGIAFIAAIMYALSWEVSYSRMGDEFNKKMIEQYMARIDSNLPADEAEAEKKQIIQNFEDYKNPVIRFGMTLMEIFPVGILITLISAGLLRKKELLPASK